jgi:hypothetical protein
MNHIRSGAVLGASCFLFFAAWLAAMPGGGAARLPAGADAGAATASDESSSVAAFKAMLVVIRNPRCINCHSTGDFPRQGEDGHPHAMNVRRGPDGKGVTAEKCSTCHQDHNLEGLHLPPGAPNWHLPPRDMPMIWQGLTDRGICEQLKDPALNGHRSMGQLVEHFTTDKLVAWGWDPGPGRNAVPMPREEFAAKVKEWASKGAACPAE